MVPDKKVRGILFPLKTLAKEFSTEKFQVLKIRKVFFEHHF